MAQILKEEVRKRILQAATEQLLLNGEAATMRQIAQAAGLTPGNLYRYYASKEELVQAIIQPVVQGMDEVLRASTGHALTLGQQELPPLPGGLDPVQMVEQELYPLLRQVLVETLTLCRTYPMPAAILMRMESAGRQLISWFRLIIDQALLKMLVPTVLNEEAMRVIADAECQAFCSGVALLLQQCGNMPQKNAEMLMDQYLYIHAQGLAALLRRDLAAGAIEFKEDMIHAGTK